MFKPAILALALLLASSIAGRVRAEQLAALEDSQIPGVTSVTAFHSLADKANNLSVRLVEADGALNEQTGRLAEHSETLNVFYTFAKGQLSDHIQVQTSRL